MSFKDACKPNCLTSFRNSLTVNLYSLNLNVVRLNLHRWIRFAFACTTKNNETLVIRNRGKESWYAYINIINH